MLASLLTQRPVEERAKLCGVMSAEAGPGDAFKDEGNAFFKAGEHLKAAAAYTKAIKAEPNNHVFYSNRSQAFLKLNKISKAIEDADKCIALSPTFVKGYHRKATALRALPDPAKHEEACDVLIAAIEMGLDSNDLVRLGLQIKGKEFVARVDALRKGKEPEPPKPTGDAAATATTDAAKKSKPAAGTPGAGAPTAGAGTHLYELDPESFAGLMIKDVFTEVLEKKKVPTIAYLQPGPPLPGTTEEPGLSAPAASSARLAARPRPRPHPHPRPHPEQAWPASASSTRSRRRRPSATAPTSSGNTSARRAREDPTRVPTAAMDGEVQLFGNLSKPQSETNQ